MKFILIFYLVLSIAHASPPKKEIKSARVECIQKIPDITAVKAPTKKPTNPDLITTEQIKEQQHNIYELAIKNGVSRKTANLAMSLKFNVIVGIKETTQPESTLNFTEYFTRTMPQSKILDAKKFLIDNWDDLDRIENEYKVDKEIIVALMLIETYFGRILGSFNIMDSLFTLSLTSHRTEFWQAELLNVFTLVDGGKTLYSRDTTGSWAGAVGMVQFIPSSFIKLAIDGNGDGNIDTVNNKMDAFASAANYLKISGWQYKAPYLKSVKVNVSPNDFCKKAGLEYKDGILVFPDKKPNTPAFIVQKNFAVVLLWNRSLFFSTTAGIVYNELKDVSKNHP